MSHLSAILILAGVGFLSAFTGVAPSARAAETNRIREWAVGDTIDADVVTPVPLAVFNADQTETLKQSEAQKIPAVFRHDTSVARAAEAELVNRFAAARDRFLDLIESGFQQRPLQSVGDLVDPRFSESLVVFRSRNPGFPLGTNLAELWALGDGGRVVQDDWTAQLRRFTSAYLRADRLPEGERLSAPVVRIVPAEAPGPKTRANPVALRGTNVPRANLFPITRYKRDLANLAPASEKPLIVYLAGFLRPNCVYDEEATLLARDRRIQDINVVDRYDAGETIARRGQVVDARLKLALDSLRAHQEADLARESAARLKADLERVQTEAGVQLQSIVEAEQLKATAAVNAVQQDVAAAELRNRRLMAGAAVASVACLVFAVLWWRHRRRQRRLERSTGWDVVPAEGSATDAGLWRERALAAEARAEKAAAMLRTHLLPHMARWMMSEMVQRLLSQRSVAHNSHHRAELEVAELAERLEKLQAPLEERRRAYEARIAELESELAAKDQQNQELIQARIESTRRRMESEHAAGEPWN